MGEHHIPREKPRGRVQYPAREVRYLHVSKELHVRPHPLFKDRFEYYLERGDGKTYRKPKNAGG